MKPSAPQTRKNRVRKAAEKFNENHWRSDIWLEALGCRDEKTGGCHAPPPFVAAFLHEALQEEILDRQKLVYFLSHPLEPFCKQVLDSFIRQMDFPILFSFSKSFRMFLDCFRPLPGESHGLDNLIDALSTVLYEQYCRQREEFVHSAGDGQGDTNSFSGGIDKDNEQLFSIYENSDSIFALLFSMIMRSYDISKLTVDEFVEIQNKNSTGWYLPKMQQKELYYDLIEKERSKYTKAEMTNFRCAFAPGHVYVFWLQARCFISYVRQIK